jgi:TonB family protein
MDALWIYLLQSAVSLLVLYAVYTIFLKRDTFYQANRLYLMGTVVFSLAMPMLTIFWIYPWNAVNYTIILDPVVISPDEVREALGRHMSVFEVMLAVYLTGVTLFAIRFFFQVYQIRRLVRRYKVIKKGNDRLVVLPAPHAPFSFFKLIFVSREVLSSDNIRQILAHERVHIRQMHSADLLALEILTIIQWFNPVIWFYRRSVKEIHEFLADQGVVDNGENLTEYQNVLLNQAMGIQLNDLTHNFNKSLIKKRIIMMTKERSGPASRWKLLLPVPVILSLSLVFTANMSIAQNEEKVLVNTEENKVPGTDAESQMKAAQAAQEEEVFREVAVAPEFSYQGKGLVEYLVGNIRYPEEARKTGLTGTVYVGFTVSKSGKVIDPKVVKSSDPAFDAEALRVIREMPAWIPGKDETGKPVNVAMVLPIQFALKKDKTE